ncbi:MAG: hypothetical protein ACO3RV_06645 [Luteolibacter sp.]
MNETSTKIQRRPSWRRVVLRLIMICGGCIAIMLPAWLPNRAGAPIERGTVELLQAFLLAGAAVVAFGAASHAGAYRPVCRVLGLGFFAAFTGEIEDFVSGILKWPFPEAGLVALILLVALVTIFRHRRVMAHFVATLGHHAGSGLIAGALLIIYVFNRVIGAEAFWRVSLGDAFSPEIPKICRSYLELLATYLMFIGAMGLSITLARRRDAV